jgi:hypothetical protein
MKRKKGSGKGFIRIRIEDLLEGIRIDSENCVRNLRSCVVLKVFKQYLSSNLCFPSRSSFQLFNHNPMKRTFNFPNVDNICLNCTSLIQGTLYALYDMYVSVR